MVILNQGIMTKQIHVTWIQIALLYIIKIEDVYKDIESDAEKRFYT